MEMRRADRLAEKKTKTTNEVQRGPRAKKKRSDSRITNITKMDTGTVVEMFKFLNYYQLAKNSLVSKKFRDVIRTHRHKLALLYVDSLVMSNFRRSPSVIRVFGQTLSPEAYDELVVRNGYSKQIPIEGRVVGKQSAQYGLRDYVLWAFADYKGSTNVFYAQTKLSRKHWPLFQHFVRLLTDPCVYIRFLKLIPEIEVLNLLAGAMNPDRGRLHCKNFSLDVNGQTLINWTKKYMCCDEIIIEDNNVSNYNEELVDLLLTGANCTSAIVTDCRILTKVIIDFVEKFMDLKSSSECQVVESIRGMIANRDVVEVMKRDYGKFIVKEERHEGDGTEHVLDLHFVNNNVRKKLHLSVKFLEWLETYNSTFVMTIKNV